MHARKCKMNPEKFQGLASLVEFLGVWGTSIYLSKARDKLLFIHT